MAWCIDSVDLGGNVVPVIGDRPDAPAFATENEDAVVPELVDVDFLTQAIETDWLVSRGY